MVKTLGSSGREHRFNPQSGKIAHASVSQEGKKKKKKDNMLSRLVMTFLSGSKHLLISWLQSPSAAILESKKIKSLTVSIASPSIYHEVIGQDAMILVF